MINELLALVSSVALAGSLSAATPQVAPKAGGAPTTLPARAALPGWLAWLGADGALPASAAPTASDVVDKVQGFYASVKQVSAKFRQSVTNATFGGDPKVNDGRVYIQKPGKMRWDYFAAKKGAAARAKKSFISNGEYLYVVEYDNKQILKKSLEKDLMPVAVSFLYGKGDLKADFTAALDASGRFGAKGDLVLKLTPKKPSAQYKNLYLVVDAKDFHVTQSVIIDSSNNTNHFRFFAPDFEKPIKESWFEFNEKNSAVKNFRIVDADQDDKAKSAPTDVATPAIRKATPPLEMPPPQPARPEPAPLK
ncbi:MAG: outer membrane lipoprotein carrier protein LolA [Kofleriaceae bacterium]